MPRRQDGCLQLRVQPSGVPEIFPQVREFLSRLQHMPSGLGDLVPVQSQVSSPGLLPWPFSHPDSLSQGPK